MDLQQKYLGDKLVYEFEYQFLETMEQLSLRDSIHIIYQIEKNLDELPFLTGWTQNVAGVVPKTKPLFFEIEYVKHKESTPVFLSLNKISSDEYLDHFINKTTLS
jgi:hypothetical protein